MKRCLHCGQEHDVVLAVCPRCAVSPPKIGGFQSYAPELACGGGGFKQDYFKSLAALEAANFWFRGRNELILWALQAYCPDFRNLIEIGCGTGFVLAGIAQRFDGRKLYGSEIFSAGIALAAARLPNVEFMQMDARHIPFVDEFDVVGAFDVLEHIEEDESVLTQVRSALRTNGFAVFTVPQHPWLWSDADDFAFHVRRYRAGDLHRKFEQAGFRIVRSTSFVTSLLPAMAAARLLRKRGDLEAFDAERELTISPWLNATFLGLIRAELALIRRGIDLPAGGSRLVVAQRR
ncbi:MAG: class I SAM-dependent methyltransferase [Burkholderiales bacterium]|nr:MAG: class I SAM-dependent methyltransferase [Burkholderiales bacterium]